jgi:hypothetical protein
LPTGRVQTNFTAATPIEARTAAAESRILMRPAARPSSHEHIGPSESATRAGGPQSAASSALSDYFGPSNRNFALFQHHHQTCWANLRGRAAGGSSHRQRTVDLIGHTTTGTTATTGGLRAVRRWPQASAATVCAPHRLTNLFTQENRTHTYTHAYGNYELATSLQIERLNDDGPPPRQVQLNLSVFGN